VTEISVDKEGTILFYSKKKNGKPNGPF